MASLPRPSLTPPTGPLPSIPTAKTRRSMAQVSPDSPDGETPPLASGLPTPGGTRNVSSSSIPMLNSLRGESANSSSGNLSSPESNPSAPTTPAPGRQVRKTLSYGSFPRPPEGLRGPGTPQGPASTGSTPRVPSRASSLVNGHGERAVSARSSLRTSGPVPTPLSRDGQRTSTAGSDAAASPSHGDPQLSRGRGSTRGGKDKGNVIVSVRVRPELGSGDATRAENEWRIEGPRALISYKGKEGGEYYYDNVFTTHDKNARVYDSSAKRLVRRVMEGYHGTVFAYGMTGTGKTFSMQGTAKSPGVIPLAITDIFSFIRETPYREFLLRVSYLEIYNEKIYDLLSAPIGPNATGLAQQEEIKLREDSKRGVYATPLKEEIVQSPTQLLRVIARGDQCRRTSSTQYNTRSSRSHAVVQIVVESRERAPASGALPDNNKKAVAPGGVRVSTLSLIDLAGSERAAESKERRTEGAHINKSLLTLGNVISKLSGNKDSKGNPTDKDGKHLPYRDSKLTRLLQSALAGNSLISILCTIQLSAIGTAATATTHTGETLNTLKFAARAKNNIVSHAKKAEEAHIGDAGSRALLDRYRMEIVDLRKQLEGQRQQQQKERDDEEEKAKEIEAENRHEEQMLEMQLARTALKERIEHLNRLILSSKSIGVNSLGGPNRSYSSLSLRQQRDSMASNGHAAYFRSLRSSSSTQTLDVIPQGDRMSSASFATNTTLGNQLQRQESTSTLNLFSNENFEENVDESYGENGDGTATLTVHIRALQADLADRNRYISVLEKRLLQARKSSRSRVSMGFAPRVPMSSHGDEDIGSTEALLRDKDGEIADLRARLDDKDRMLTALRSVARKRDTADSGASLHMVTSNGDHGISSPARSPSSKQSNESPAHGRRDSASTIASAMSQRTALSPRASSAMDGKLGPLNAKVKDSSGSRSGKKRNKSVDEMTRILDEMIQERAGTEASGVRLSQKMSLMNGAGVVAGDKTLRRTGATVGDGHKKAASPSITQAAETDGEVVRREGRSSGDAGTPAGGVDVNGYRTLVASHEAAAVEAGAA